MKVLKKNEHSLMPRPIMVQGRSQLAVGVAVFYDLTAPDSLLEEQELWKTVPKELGDVPVLDQGMPKMNGEYLLRGDCCAPRHEQRQSAEVLARVGNLEKRLYVFGDRRWLDGGRISSPDPFSRIPLTWENAFGGPKWERNPLGKGIVSSLVDDKVSVPLPNVEDPANLVGSADDRPEPAGFAPLDMTLPQRNMRSGTFDDRWKAERWPGLPDDYDYNFFNEAPPDQRLKGFFSGDESLEIHNMHPDYQFLQSSLPGVRIRCFTTHFEGFKRFEEKSSFREVFREVQLHPETLWLFPNILRGVLIFRGAVEVTDEDMADVARIYLATERMADAPLSKEHYFEEQNKALDRGVKVDMAPLEAAKGKISEAVLAMKNAPKVAAEAKKRALGQVPVMPRTGAELAGGAKKIMTARLATVDKLEALAGGMNQRWGHMVRTDMSVFGKLRQKVAGIEKKLDTAVGKLDAATKKGAAKKAAMLEDNKKLLQDNLTPEQIEKSGVNPDKLLPDRSLDPWHEQGFPFVVQCRRNLEQDDETRSRLTRMGIQRTTIRRHWLGVNPEAAPQQAPDWGLDKPAKFEMPAGIVMPRFDGKRLNRILMRPPDAADGKDYKLGQRESLVPGSDETPLFLPSAWPMVGAAPQEMEGDGKEKDAWAPVVVVADELQALLMEQEVGDTCAVLSMKTAAEKPGKDAAEALDKARAVLVVMPKGQDANSAAWEAWGKALAEANPLPLPKGRTLFEARASGVDIRRTVMDALPPVFAKHHELFPDFPEDGSPPEGAPKVKVPGLGLDIAALVSGLMQEIRGVHQPKIDKVKGNRGKMIEGLKKQFGGQGLDPERSLAEAAKQPKKSYAEMGNEMAQQMKAQGARAKAAGHLPAGAEAKITQNADKVREISQKSQARFERHTARLKQMTQKADSMKAQAASMKLPGGAQERMAAAGLDPDAMKVMTREEVIERYKAGLSFEKRNLTGIDLSGLELPGIDLRKAILQKTVFKECNLQGALLDGAIASETDFSKADLSRAKMKGAILSKAKLKEASLREANLERVTLRGADMSKADCTGARLRMLHADKAKLDEAVFADTDCSLSILGSCSCKKLFMRGAKLHKFVFRDCALDEADFGGATLERAVFQGSKGEKVRFTGANMDHSRIISNSSFPGANLEKTSLKGACFRESSLPDSIFSGAVLDTALIEGCSLIRANLSRISAKQARLTKCDLESADLSGTNLAMGSLRMTRLVQTDFTGANLFAVDFYKAIVGKTVFRLANLKRTLLHDNTDLIT